MKFSLRLNNDLPVSTYIDLAQTAESVGFDQFWVSDDLFLRSAPVILTAIAAHTKRIEIGSCIVNPYTLHPAEMAMFAATLDEFSGGRFNLGLSSGAGDFLDWIGIEQKKPRTAVIETVQAVNALLSGEHVAMDGDFLQWRDEAYMRFQPERRVPIYIGAMSPRMLEAIGSIADGGLPLLFPPEHLSNVMPYIAKGAHSNGRDIRDVDVAACIWVSIGDDAVRARDMLAEKVAYYGHALSPMILQQLGLTHADFAEIEHAMMVENDVEKAKSLVTPQMLQIGITGDVKQLITRLESLVALGSNHLSFGPPLGPNLKQAIRLIGEHIIPYFRS